jgi:tetratricopeptide (TPR) repeat protein
MKFYISIFFLTFSLGIIAEEGLSSSSDYLERAKFKLINGDIGMSEFYLNQIKDDKKKFIDPAAKRYHAIIEFIKGHYEKSNNILNEIPETDPRAGGVYYKQICLLKILNALAINDFETLKNNQMPCRLVTENNSKNEQFWLDTMIKLKLQDAKGLKKNLFQDANDALSEDEMTKLWLKAGLYLNKEEDFIKLLSNMGETPYQYKRIAEIIGLMYFRRGDTKTALAFVDNIDSANAENIKGNISLQNKELEVAFGHFKLAMQKKQDSLNALERSIPLSWLLKQYEDGLLLLENSSLKNIDPKKLRSIKIAFLIKLKKFTEAETEIKILVKEYKNYPPKDVSVLNSYISIMIGATEAKYDRRLSEELAEKACKSFDGLNCWITMKLSQWDNIGKTIQRNDDIFSDTSMTIDTLKSAVKSTPLIEESNIDQETIEELDSQTISIK